MLGTPPNPTSMRRGAGSPSNYEGGKLYSKRAREIQAEEGVGPSLWAPLNTTNSIREHETIQEEVTSPSYGETTTPTTTSTPPGLTPPIGRRARAGTMPSRLPPGGLLPPPGPPMPVTSRPSPSVSPFKGTTMTNGEVDAKNGPAPLSTSSVASRLRSGSLNLPPRANYVNPFGPSIFNTPWAATTRERNVSTSSTNGPTSPAQSSFSKDDEHNGPMRTLDYLGLADPPTSRVNSLPRGYDQMIEAQRTVTLQPQLMSDVAALQRNLTRLRSYSVNAKEKYEEDEEEELNRQQYDGRSGNVTPGGATAAAIAHAQAQAQAAAVLSYANSFTTSRPRARTAGILDSPAPRTMKSYMTTPSRLGDSMSASEINVERDYFGLDASQLAANGLLPRPSSGGEAALLSTVDEGLEGPTRALWLGNIPASTTTSSLVAIFQTYGPIESARVLTHKNCGFVNFERIESAVQSRAVLNGKEIFPGAGPVRIGFAKVPTTPNAGTPGPIGTPSPEPNATSSGAQNELGATSPTASASADLDAAITVPKLSDLKNDIVKIVQEFGATEPEAERIGQSVDISISYDNFADEIPSIPEPSHNRVHDAPKLRDIRKRIDNNTCSQAEIEEIAEGMLDEIAELSSDYLGNTVVQKLFEFCSEEVKYKMLEKISPHLAEIGVHKNGTWAGQKIIDVARTESQKNLICDSLRPYTVALFLDQYGNYVLQCCLRFGAPYNNFIFESMLGKIWDISQGRFGARAMRACLESHHANKDQQRMMAAAISLHSVQLATNANGALLLTWLLDTCTFPNRRTVLAPRLVPHLVHLCTHKVAYLTVLKVINQRNEPEAREAILRAMFFSPGDKTLEAILIDHSCGATLIFKVLTTPFFDEALRAEVVQNVKNVLLKIKAHPAQGYKRLMDEVGLPTRSGSTKEHSRERRGHSTASPSRGERNRSRDHHNNREHHHHNQHQPHGTPTREFNQPINPAAVNFNTYDQAAAYGVPNGQVPRNGGMDINQMAQTMEQLSLYGQAAPMVAQQQYQASMMAGRGGRPAPQNYYPAVPANMPGYVNQMGQMGQMPGMGAPAGMMNTSPITSQNGMAGSPIMNVGIPQGFNPMLAQNMMGGYGGYPPAMNGYPQQQANPATSNRRVS
ncbi:hypothetical protein H072_8011 [Dactylellina haptotyla CBS 200.50]|uniref:PUM-HD domain-containing protein n=1 Tax=Dactylellina haptotyla (strain CBS 200.50) TaxID=1284197 RepID=S8AB84_DACHA|nr:hypothetical protein H072_8011 [Dactylellina haptotyla CBS 200.50]